MRGDQASTLREIRRRENTGAPSRRLGRPHLTDAVPGEIRVLSVTSGKGGVGKTNIAANLAYLLSRANKKTLILDADAEDDRDFTERLNPDSITTKRGVVEPVLGATAPGDRFQFMRVGYFCTDPDTAPTLPVFNRIVGLKDSYKG